MDELLKIFSEILEVPMDCINIETAKDDLEQWDSLAHIQLILQIEQTYNIQVPFEEISEIKKIGNFLRYIK